MDNTTFQTRPHAIYGIILYSARVHWVSIGGLRGEGNNMNQPPDTICAPPCAGNISDSRGRELSPPSCPACDMLLTWGVLNRHHPDTDLCAQGVERNITRMAEEEARAGAVTKFQDYDRPLETVLQLKYLGILLTENDDEWPVVIAKIHKSRNIWSHLDQILGREGADNRMLGSFHAAVIQAILSEQAPTYLFRTIEVTR